MNVDKLISDLRWALEQLAIVQFGKPIEELRAYAVNSGFAYESSYSRSSESLIHRILAIFDSIQEQQ